MGITALPAQAPALALQKAGANETNLCNLVSQLAQNAQMVLLGITLFMGIACFFCIWNACAGQNKHLKNAHTFPTTD